VIDLILFLAAVVIIGIVFTFAGILADFLEGRIEK